MNSLFSFAASIAAVIVLIAPFVFFDMTFAYVLTFVFGTVLSFLLGSYVGKLGDGGPYQMGLKYAVLAVVGAVISHLVGDLLSYLI